MIAFAVSRPWRWRCCSQGSSSRFTGDDSVSQATLAVSLSGSQSSSLSSATLGVANGVRNRMDFLFELIIELVLQLVIEGLTELGLHSIGEAFHNREKRNPYFAATGYLLLGLISGFVSLLVFPHSFIRSTRFHGVSLVTMPLLGGAMMSGIGMLRRRRGQELIQLDTFACGALFGLGMSLIRFLFTH